jgi:hypothetical protein
VAVKAAHFARPPGLGLDGREHGDNIRVRRGSEYSITTLQFQNLTKKHGASTDFFNRCTWYLNPSIISRSYFPLSTRYGWIEFTTIWTILGQIAGVALVGSWVLFWNAYDRMQVRSNNTFT